MSLDALATLIVLPCPIPGHAAWPCDYAGRGEGLCAGQIRDYYEEFPGEAYRWHVCDAHWPLWDRDH